MEQDSSNVNLSPDPLTPEERFNLYQNDYDVGALWQLCHALREMVASLDAESGLQSVAINRLERGQRTADPDTVLVPRSLVDALSHVMATANYRSRDWVSSYRPNSWDDLKREYDAWKAGQG